MALDALVYNKPMSQEGAQNPLPFGAGTRWVFGGLTLIRRQPLRLMVLGLVLQLIAGFSQIGVLGLLFILAIPAFTAGMLQGVHTVGQGERPSLLALFTAFSEPSRLGRLLLIGAIGLACMILAAAFALAGSVDMLDPALITRIEAGEVEAVAELDPVFIQRVLFGLVLGLLLGGCLSFYAVPLVWFSNQSLGRAIALGLLGMLRQWRALTMMGLVLGVLSIPVAVLTAFVLTAQMAQGSVSPVLSLLMLLTGVAYQLLLFSTQYASYRAIFGGTPQVQLVA